MLKFIKNAGISRRIWLLISIPAAVLLDVFSGIRPSFAEWYAKNFYPLISLPFNRLTGLAPISIGEILIGVLLLGILSYLVFFIVLLCRKKDAVRINVIRFVTNVFCFLGILYFLFMLNCGINYSRIPFAQTCGLEVKPSSKAELIQLCSSLADDVNRLRAQVKTDKNSVMKLRDKDFGKTAEEAKASYDKLADDYLLLKSGYSAPKPVKLSRLMSLCNITGMFFPYTFEANVNTEAPQYTIPATMCHELTHLRGFMREDEANFAGYLACMKSSDPDFQYSGSMLAFTYASNALDSADPKAASSIFAKLNAGVRKDLAYNNAYWQQFQGPVANVSSTVNDGYLKANSQKDGIQSYGRMVDLLLARQRTLAGMKKRTQG